MAKLNTSNRNRVRVKKSRSGLGLFSFGSFYPGEFIVEYTGERISAEEADRRGGRYLFEIDEKTTIDGKTRQNMARYINHACKSNAEAEIEDDRIYVYAKQRIESGKEITIDYGKEYFDEFIKPYNCQCFSCTEKAL